MRHRLRVGLKHLSLNGRRSFSCGAVRLLSTTPAADSSQSSLAADDTFVLKSKFSPTPQPTCSLVTMLLDKFKNFTPRTALVDGVTGASITYGEVIDGIHRWGNMVQQRTKPGSHTTVAMFMENGIYYPSIFYGTMAGGGVTTTLNPNYTPEEVVNQLEDSGASVLVVDPSGEETALKALHLLKQKGSNLQVEMFTLGNSTSGLSDLRSFLADSSSSFASVVEVSNEQVVCLPYSSGTTGKPKGVCIPNGAFTACLEMFGHEDILFTERAESQEVMIGLLPFYHIYGILGIMSVGLSIGSKIIVLPKFQVDTFTDSIKKWKPSILPLVPPLMKFLVESGDIKTEHLQNCHSVVCGAAPLAVATIDKFLAKAGDNVVFQEGYGMTEVGVTHCTPRRNSKLGYCGVLMPHCQAKLIDDETGKPVPANTRGELWVKTPSMMSGYHNNPEATRSTITEDGWLQTGDIATYDDDHYFSIVDRIKELIKVKGFQVSPSELEDVLLKVPGVADVGVVGIPHDRYGEVPRAYIVKSKNSDVSENQVNSHMKDRLSAHKQLEGGIRFVTELPKNPTGKLLRRVLRETAEKEG